MTKEEKELLLQDLCARLPYKPYVEISDGKDWYFGKLLAIEIEHDKLCGTITNSIAIFKFLPERVKLLLRPMSSMTEEESKEFALFQTDFYVDGFLYPIAAINMINWLNAHHFDYTNLIPKGVALEAPKNMYSTKTE